LFWFQSPSNRGVARDALVDYTTGAAEQVSVPF